MTLLTMFAAVQAGLALIYRDSMFVAMCKIAIFAMLLNAVTHCVMSLRRGRILPGTWSAALLVLPYSIVAIVFMRAVGGEIHTPISYSWQDWERSPYCLPGCSFCG